MRSFHNLWEAFRWNDSKSGYVEAELMDVLAEAHSEWKHAKIYFNNVTDPDLIDHAIFFMGAAEKKYIYLLKRAREKGICVEPFSLNE
jgi:hypothetical protein